MVLHAQPEAERGSPSPRAGGPGLSALEITGLLEGPGLAGLDRLTRLAAQVLGVPIALMTLVTDREQFLASTVGLAEPGAFRRPISRSHPFCRYVVESGLPLVLDDGRLDELSADPTVPDLGMVAFAGFPLLDPDNHVLGAFCAIDVEPRNWTSEDVTVLEGLAASAAAEISLLLANQQLTHSAAWLHDALASSQDGYLSIDARGTVQDWNPAAERLFGWAKAEVSGRNLGEVIIPERFRSAHDRALVGIVAGETSAPGGGRPLELTAVDRAGMEFRLRTTLQVATSAGGTVIHAWLQSVRPGRARQSDLERERTFLAAVLDRAEAALDEERRRLRQAQQIGRSGSWEWEVASNVVTWSENLFELYGVDPAKFTADQANHRCIHPDDLEAMGTAFGLCADTGRAVVLRYRVVRPTDGEVRIFEARAERLTTAGARAGRVVGTAMDVTDQVRAQGEAASRDAMLRAIIANSESLISVKDLAGRYVLANEAFERAFSVVEAELLGKDDIYVDPVQAPTWRANDLRAQEGDYTVEEWSDRADGRHFYDSVKFPLYDPDGRLHATCGISVDVTARRLTAEAMAEARDAALAANAAKSAFLAIMSHEIRTPMNAVIGMTDLLMDTELDPRQLDYLQTVRTSGDALLAIINDILDFSRIEAGEMELESNPFDLRRCIDDTLLLVAGAAAGLDLVAHVDVGCPQFVRGDVNRLRQVLVNLVGNAVKFTERGDVLVSVTTPESPPTDDAIGDAVELRFSVRDTGIGIPAERIDRLFKSFSQVDASTTRVYGGSGLGLAISRALVQAMGADITVTSEVGVGSTFEFTLRLARCDGARPEPTPHDSPPELLGRRVLIVDDNDTNRRILRIQLEGWGMSCADVADPAQALAIVQNATIFDVAILDMNMPGIDGAQLAQMLRDLPAGQNLPLVLLTSLDSKLHTESAALFAGYHTKPVRSGALRSMLAEILAPDPDHRAPTPATPAARPSPAPVTPLRVLLAEDNLVNQKVAQSMLRNLGHTVVVAADGQAALEALRQDDYDVVLMDIHMPTMDGLDATRAIRAQIPAAHQPHIVAMTASALPEDRRAAAEAGMDGYLLKPVRTAELAESLRAVPVVAPEPGEATGVVAAVDLDVLRRLTHDMGASSPRSLIEAYLGQSDQWIAELVAAAGDGDATRVSLIAHTLGSSSTLLGAPTLAGLLADAVPVESEVDSPEGLSLAAASVAAEYERVSVALLAERARLMTPNPPDGDQQ